MLIMDKIGEEYLKLRELGSGGFADVYKVKHLEYSYVRALRILRTHIDSEDNKLYKSFLRECKVLLRLGNGCHPNIVHIYQPRLVDGRALVEMDYVDGEDLRHLIEHYEGKVPIEETLRMVRDMGSALAYCHHDIYRFCYDKMSDNLEDNPDDGRKALITPDVEQRLVEKYRVIHNDIHTGNIMRRSDGAYIMLDFGLAVDGESDVVGSSRIQNGAIEFKSPERADGTEPTPQDDIYSFGCVLYAMLMGHPPFPIQATTKELSFGEQVRIYRAHKETPPPAIMRADAPQWLIDLTMRCLAKKPSDRYADGYMMNQEIMRHLLEAEQAERVDKASQRLSEATIQELELKIAEIELVLTELKKLINREKENRTVEIETNDYLNKSKDSKTKNNGKVEDLETVIDVNLKFEFITTLFRSNYKAYTDFIKGLNQINDRAEAMRRVDAVARHNEWDWKNNESVINEFYEVLNKKF